MKKSWVVGLACLIAVTSAEAQNAASPAVVPLKGKMLYDANDGRVAQVDRVTADGSVQIIIDGKLVTVPADTLSTAGDRLTTKLTKNQVRDLH